MCQELGALRQAIAGYAERFDAKCLLPSQAREVVRICARVEASLASVKALASARAAEGTAWQLEGYRSAADQLARDAGMSPSAARRALETGQRMARLPDVARAALAGDLSAEQAAAVSDGAAANPARTRELIERSKDSSLPELNEAVARAKAEVIDQEARRKQIHRKRSFRRWTDRDGAFQAHLYGNPEGGIALWRLLDPIRRRLIVLRRGSSGPEPLDAIDYDAVMALASVAAGEERELSLDDLLELGLFPQFGSVRRVGGEQRQPDAPNLFHPSSNSDEAASDNLLEDAGNSARRPRSRKKLAGSPVRVMIRVDLDTLLRGVPIQGELCELDGYGPIPVSVVEELMANGNTFVVGILTRCQAVQGVFHYGRRPNSYQSSALDFVYPTCAVKGCTARAGLQSDHREEWRKTKFTVFDLLDRLCPYHHRFKTHRGWALVEGSGKRAFVPPEDPRHPRHRHGSASNSPSRPESRGMRSQRKGLRESRAGPKR